MTKEKLGRKASWCGWMTIKNANQYTGHTTSTIFRDIKHYFNERNEEIGYVAFPWSVCGTVVTFDPPRMWSKEFLAAITTK